MDSAQAKLIKNCKFSSRTRCWPVKQCEPHDCAMGCKQRRFEDSECVPVGKNGFPVCFCLWGCQNSTEPQPPLPPPNPLQGVLCGAAMD